MTLSSPMMFVVSVTRLADCEGPGYSLGNTLSSSVHKKRTMKKEYETTPEEANDDTNFSSGDPAFVPFLPHTQPYKT